MLNPWDSAAAIRKRQIDEGKDITFLRVFVPYYIALFQNIKPISVLEIGSGTGHLANYLSRFCEHYYGIEKSTQMYATSKEIATNDNITLINDAIENFRINQTFDLVLSHLCAHVIDDFQMLAEQIYNLTDSNSTWMLSIPHPCFYNDYKKIFDKYEYIKTQKTEFDLKITNDNEKIEKVPYIHRPLEIYINTLINNGLMITKIQEIMPDENIQLLYGEKWETPRYLILLGRGQKQTIK